MRRKTLRTKRKKKEEDSGRGGKRTILGDTLRDGMKRKRMIRK